MDAQAGKGMYANPNARKVSPEELVKAQATWRNFLTKLLAVIRSDSEQFRAKNGVLDTERNFGHALIQLSVSEEAYGDAQLISEIHQVQSHFVVICLCNVFLHSSYSNFYMHVYIYILLYTVRALTHCISPLPHSTLHPTLSAHVLHLKVLRHGYETIAGTLSWMFYALYRHPKVNKTHTAVISPLLYAVSSHTQWLRKAC